MSTLTQTETILSMVDSSAHLARLACRSPQVIPHWKETGFIPQPLHPVIIDNAKKEGIYIHPSAFIRWMIARDEVGAEDCGCHADSPCTALQAG